MTEEQEDKLMSSKLFQLLSTVYGPYAFGIASLLIIWFTIVSPQLERQAIDFDRNEKSVQTLKEVAHSMDQVSRSMERTASVLETLVEKINGNK
jgi:hypothetical protein